MGAIVGKNRYTTILKIKIAHSILSLLKKFLMIKYTSMYSLLILVFGEGL